MSKGERWPRASARSIFRGEILEGEGSAEKVGIPLDEITLGELRTLADQIGIPVFRSGKSKHEWDAEKRGQTRMKR